METQLKDMKTRLFKRDSELQKANSIIFSLHRAIAALQEELADCRESLKNRTSELCTSWGRRLQASIHNTAAVCMNANAAALLSYSDDNAWILTAKRDRGRLRGS
ncbi:hypothetical protein L484_014737 [Morus notabilis]|uniref:Uncharacterized protein n=1 Tax=Morus notabilis TaxID=981085 RepID=W9QEL1_9ROSA|nr:hypothetical protein L484_014737 [Morus notabilis]